jgi:ssDNA-binding Zn-finger/Zn-ribbon topoisomerase 1
MPKRKSNDQKSKPSKRNNKKSSSSLKIDIPKNTLPVIREHEKDKPTGGDEMALINQDLGGHMYGRENVEDEEYDQLDKYFHNKALPQYKKERVDAENAINWEKRHMRRSMMGKMFPDLPPELQDEIGKNYFKAKPRYLGEIEEVTFYDVEPFNNRMFHRPV